MKEKLKRLEEALHPERHPFYVDGDHITNEEFETIMSAPSSKRLAIFQKTYKKNGKNVIPQYSVERFCKECGQKVVFKNLSACAVLSTYPSSPLEAVCQSCKNKRQEELEKEFQERSRQERKDRFLELKAIASPDYSYKPDMSYRDKWQDLKKNLWGEECIQYCKSLLLELDYVDFLKTPYWDAVSSLVKQKAKWKCQLCGNGGTLNVHHSTYDNHGDEASHLEDLICLCQDCHYKYHEEG